MTSLTVAFVSAYPPDRGRLSEYAEALVNSMVEEGGINIIVHSDSHGVGAKGVIVKPSWTPDRPLSILMLLARLLKTRASLVHFNLHFAVFGKTRLSNFLGFLVVGLANLVKHLFRFKTVLTLHNLPEAIGLEHVNMGRGLLNRLGFLIAERLCLLCDGVVVHLDLYRKLLQHRFNRRVHVIPHGSWTLTVPRNHQGGRDSIMFIGYLSPAKDLEVLKQAFLRLRSKYPWLRLLLSTSPHPNFPETISQLRAFKGVEGVELLGYASNQDLPKHLAKSYAVVLPYKTATGCSGVVHLVASTGVPIVATDLPEMRELLHSGAGIILTPLNPSRVAMAVERLIEDEDLQAQLARRNLDFSARRSWSTVAERYLDLYRGLLTRA